MKHIHFIAISLIVVVLLCIFFFTRKSIPSRIPDSTEIDILKQTILLQSASFNRLHFTNGIDSVTDYDGKRAAIKDIFRQRRLVLRFNQTNCDVCVETELQTLHELSRFIGDTNIVLLASYARQRDFKITCQTYKIALPAYNIPSEAISSPAEQANIPYLFVVDSTLSTGYMFVPNKELPSVSEDYYRMISGFWDIQEAPKQIADAKMKQTTLQIDNNTHRFETLKTGDDATATFTITNTGKEPLLIQEIQSTCGCTVPEWNRQSIPPGQTTIVQLKYDTKLKGVFSKKAFIFSNAKDSPHGVSISGEVIGFEN